MRSVQLVSHGVMAPCFREIQTDFSICTPEGGPGSLSGLQSSPARIANRAMSAVGLKGFAIILFLNLSSFAALVLRPAPCVSIQVPSPSLAPKLVANLESYAANF